MQLLERRISNALKYYDNKDFIDKKRAHFLFYFLIVALVISITTLITTTYFQLQNPWYDTLYVPVLLPILGALISYVFALRLLVKGKFVLSANLLIVASLLAVWIIVFFDNNSIINKLNTLVFILAAITVFPLLINKKRQVIIYGLINLVAFLIFILHLYYKSDYKISLFDFRDTLIDVSFAISFSIVIQYFTLRINNMALKKAREEIEERKRVGVELQHHKDNLESLVKEKTKQLEVFNEDLQAANDDLYDKNRLINEKNEELKATLIDLKETQLQLLQAEKMASLGILTAGVSHELNNPLNYIMGAYVGLENYFEKSGCKDEKKLRLLLDSIKAGVEKSSKIIKGLNQFSRNSMWFNEDCDVHSIIDNCLLMLHAQSKSKAQIIKNYSKDTLIVKGNVGKLHQAFINIISNSIYAIEEKGEIQITTNNTGQSIIIEISDTGCGIKEEDISHIVDPFFTTKPPGQGTGLGLSITYSIIKAHGGIIDFESEIGKGTRVIIKIPDKTQKQTE